MIWHTHTNSNQISVGVNLQLFETQIEGENPSTIAASDVMAIEFADSNRVRATVQGVDLTGARIVLADGSEWLMARDVAHAGIKSQITSQAWTITSRIDIS